MNGRMDGRMNGQTDKESRLLNEGSYYFLLKLISRELAPTLFYCRFYEK